jgi:hypothetical protein
VRHNQTLEWTGPAERSLLESQRGRRRAGHSTSVRYPRNEHLMIRLSLFVLATALISGCASSPPAPSAKSEAPHGFAGRWETVEPVKDPYNVAAGPQSGEFTVNADGTMSGKWTMKDGTVAGGGTGTWKAQSASLAIAKNEGSPDESRMELIDANHLRMTGAGQAIELRRVE